MAHARCDSCGKAYRVSQPERTYRCKACGGAVRAIVEEESTVAAVAADPDEAKPGGIADADAAKGGPTCKACGSPNRESARFCKACGAALDGEAAGEPQAPAEKTRMDRLLAAKELNETYRLLKSLRALYAIGAVAWGAVFALGAVGLYRVLFTDAIEDAGPIWLLFARSAVGLAISIVGAVKILSQPFFWSLLIASTNTLNAAVSIAQGGLSIGAVVSLVWSALLWLGVERASRVRHLLREYPDLWVSRRMKGEITAVDSESASTRRSAEAVQARRREKKRNALILGGSFAVVAAAVIVVWFLQTKADSAASLAAEEAPARAFEAVAARFVETWNASRHEDIPTFFHDDLRQKRGRQLVALFKKRGWETTLPSISGPQVLSSSRIRYRALFPLVGQAESVCLTTAWEMNDGRWTLAVLSFPR